MKRERRYRIKQDNLHSIDGEFIATEVEEVFPYAIGREGRIYYFREELKEQAKFTTFDGNHQWYVRKSLNDDISEINADGFYWKQSDIPQLTELKLLPRKYYCIKDYYDIKEGDMFVQDQADPIKYNCNGLIFYKTIIDSLSDYFVEVHKMVISEPMTIENLKKGITVAPAKENCRIKILDNMEYVYLPQ